jgi:hypothetical protein
MLPQLSAAQVFFTHTPQMFAVPDPPQVSPAV